MTPRHSSRLVPVRCWRHCRQHPGYGSSEWSPAWEGRTVASAGMSPLSFRTSAEQENDFLSPNNRRTSEPQEKLPESRRRARNLEFPPLTRTRLTVTFEDSLVMAGWRPSSNLHNGVASIEDKEAIYFATKVILVLMAMLARKEAWTHFLFFLHLFCLPPVRRLLWRESREIPA